MVHHTTCLSSSQLRSRAHVKLELFSDVVRRDQQTGMTRVIEQTGVRRTGHYRLRARPGPTCPCPSPLGPTSAGIVPRRPACRDQLSRVVPYNSISMAEWWIDLTARNLFVGGITNERRNSDTKQLYNPTPRNLSWLVISAASLLYSLPPTILHL